MTAAHAAGLYTNLITSAVGITVPTLRRLAEAGLDHVQISIQDSERDSADHIAGYAGAFARKRALAAEVVALKIPLTVNAVMHRANIDRIGEMVTLALALGASRVEIAHVQYYGWALKNRAALMPSAEQVARAATAVEELRKQHHGQIVIDAVVPLAQRHAGRQGAPLPCRRVHSRAGILVGARALARRYLGQFAGV
jgi:pyrroloquinoline quinone biosynthesis protein E